MPYSNKLSTLCSLGETSLPSASLSLSYLILVGMGILHPSKLCFPDLTIVLWASKKSLVDHLMSPPKEGMGSFLMLKILIICLTDCTGVVMGSCSVGRTHFPCFSTRPANMLLSALISKRANSIIPMLTDCGI